MKKTINVHHNLHTLRRRNVQITEAYNEKLDMLQTELSKAKKAVQAAKADAAAALDLADAESRRAAEIEELFRLQTDDLKKTEAHKAFLVSQIACLQPNIRQAEIERAAQGRMALPALPTCPYEVLKYFESAFSDRVIFTDEAFSLCKTCTIPVDQLYKCIFNIATTLTDLFRAGCATPYKTFQEKTGFHCKRGYGEQTHKDNRLMYQFTAQLPNGQTIDTEPHITWPRIGQSINFGFDRHSSRLVIHRVGAHPEIYSSRKC